LAIQATASAAMNVDVAVSASASVVGVTGGQ
jgi:hypothetical protein